MKLKSLCLIYLHDFHIDFVFDLLHVADTEDSDKAEISPNFSVFPAITF